MNAPLTVLVTGAEDRRGLAVIRGLGGSGVRVIACGTSARSLGFYSRFVKGHHVCASPLQDPSRARHDLLSLVKRVRPDVVIAATEPMLAALNQIRGEVEPIAALAAPPASALDYALDASLLMRLAQRLGVPVPRSVDGASANQILAQVEELRFPLMASARGRREAAPVLIHTPAELEAMLQSTPDAAALLIQEYVPGVGVGVAAVCDRGDPVALFQYRREREYPATGGAATLRRSEPVDARVRGVVAPLLAATGWHGLAHLQFRHDRRTNRFTLLRIQAHFPGSTALCVDAGFNLPGLVALLHAERPLPPSRPYREGVTARWLRGDLEGLQATGTSRRQWWQVMRDFRWGVRQDEVRLRDWKPSVLQLAGLTGLVARLVGNALGRVTRRAKRLLRGGSSLQETAAGAGARERAVLLHHGR